MTTLAVSTRVVLGNPGIENVAGQVYLSLQIMNVGETQLNNVQITDITLGNAERNSPAGGFPVIVDLIGAGGVGHVTARFVSTGLTVGAKYLLTVRGSYTVGRIAYGLTLNRFVKIPALSPPAVLTLKARLESAMTTNFWNYMLFNDEAAGSNQYIATLSLAVAAPITVTGTPDGWSVETDGMTYVLWYAADLELPYLNQIPPGHSLGGFQLTSPQTRSEASASSIAAWDHSTDTAGLVLADYAITPYRFA